MRFLGTIRPLRLIEDFKSVVRQRNIRSRGLKRSRTLARYPLGDEQDVYDITTTAGTYIANGFVVHNCGPSGRLVESWWRQVGLRRSDFYIANVFPFQPPGNKINLIPISEIERYAEELIDELRSLRGPRVVVPTGNYALRALLGQPLRGKDALKISNWRGSILECNWGWASGPAKLIPTIHPAATFKSDAIECHRIRLPSDTPLCQADWKRIAEEAKSRELNIPPRTVYTPGTKGFDVHFKLIERASRSSKTILVVDIETNPKSREILCVGFAINDVWAIVLPWENGYRKLIKQLCESPCPKGATNGLYDAFWLTNEGITFHNYVWDALALHHCLDPRLPHSLAVMASLDTRWPWWKNDHKDEVKVKEQRTPFDALMRYCGYDCIGEWLLIDTYRKRLESA